MTTTARAVLFSVVVASAATSPCVARAQANDAGPLLRSALPPIRSAPAPDAIWRSRARAVDWRPLSDGRVLVNDPDARAVLVLDATLAQISIVFDTASPSTLRYPNSATRLVPGPRDTSYFLDVAAHGFRIIAPNGAVVGRQSIVDLAEAMAMTSRSIPVVIGTAGSIYYSQNIRLAPGTPGPQQLADSSILARTTAMKMGHDTLAYFAGHPNVLTVRSPPPVPGSPPGTQPVLSVTVVQPVFDVGDAWAVTSSGTPAIVRTSDFHVDWLGPNGAWRASPPVQIPLHRFTPAEKDSILAGARAAFARSNNQLVGAPGAPPAPFQIVSEPSDRVPDVAPGFVPMSAIGDLENQIWVLLGARSGGRSMGPPIYGIIDSTGRIVDRVAIPGGRLVCGFGPGGAVYLMQRMPTGTIVERVILRGAERSPKAIHVALGRASR